MCVYVSCKAKQDTFDRADGGTYIHMLVQGNQKQMSRKQVSACKGPVHAVHSSMIDCTGGTTMSGLLVIGASGDDLG